MLSLARGITVLPGEIVDRMGLFSSGNVCPVLWTHSMRGRESFSPISQLATTEAIRGALRLAAPVTALRIRYAEKEKYVGSIRRWCGE